MLILGAFIFSAGKITFSWNKKKKKLAHAYFKRPVFLAGKIKSIEQMSLRKKNFRWKLTWNDETKLVLKSKRGFGKANETNLARVFFDFKLSSCKISFLPLLWTCLGAVKYSSTRTCAWFEVQLSAIKKPSIERTNTSTITRLRFNKLAKIRYLVSTSSSAYWLISANFKIYRHPNIAS